MVIVKVKGGMGNQLFQYALGTYIEQNLNVEVKYDVSWFQLTHLRVTPRKLALSKVISGFDKKVATPKEVAKHKRMAWVQNLFPKQEIFDYAVLVFNKYFNKRYLIDQEQNLDLKQLEKYSYLDGYWQTSTYFINIRERFINSLDTLFINELPIFDQANGITGNDVAVHVRRGDYVNNAAANSHHGVCGLDYYQKGLSYFKTIIGKPRFFFFSDDMDWVKENFGSEADHIYVKLEGPNADMAEFFLLSRFHNFIIANSTYSWWAAMIGQDDNVVAPKKWFAQNNSKLVLKDWKSF